MQNLCEEKQHRMYVKMKNVPRKSRVYKLYNVKCKLLHVKCRIYVENAEMMLF